MRQLSLVVLLLLIAASTKAEQLRKIFTDEEVKLCKSQFGGPGFVSGGGWVHVLTTCAKRIDPSPAFSSLNRTHGDLGDIVAEAMCIMKSSADNGVSWGRFQTLSPNGKKGYASCKGIYDVKRSRLVVQHKPRPCRLHSKRVVQHTHRFLMRHKPLPCRLHSKLRSSRTEWARGCLQA